MTTQARIYSDLQLRILDILYIIILANQEIRMMRIIEVNAVIVGTRYTSIIN